MGNDQGLKNKNTLVESLMPYDGSELKRLPFKVALLDAETHLCVQCIFKNKYTVESKSKEGPVTCKGCDIY